MPPDASDFPRWNSSYRGAPRCISSAVYILQIHGGGGGGSGGSPLTNSISPHFFRILILVLPLVPKEFHFLTKFNNPYLTDRGPYLCTNIVRRKTCTNQIMQRKSGRTVVDVDLFLSFAQHDRVGVHDAY